MWEDDRNRLGGRWLINFEKRKDDPRRPEDAKRELKMILDNCWMETVSV